MENRGQIMRLGDLLPYISENEYVFIWLEAELISVYDGKDSIPLEHNDLHVCEGGIKKDTNGIHIEVKED